MRTLWARPAVAATACSLLLLPPPARAEPTPSSITAEVSPILIPPGGALTLTVEVSPAVAGAGLTVRERLGSGEWHVVARPAVGRDGRVTLPLGRRRAVGTYEFLVTGASGSGLVAGSSRATTRVTVDGEGSPSAWRPLHGTRAAPAHWAACTLGYLVNRRRMPSTGMADLREALRRVGQVTGARFRYDGSTSVVPDIGYRGPGRNRFVVAWAGPRHSGLLDPATAGRAGAFGDDSGLLRTGFLVFNTRWTRRSPAGFGAGLPQGAVMMHEAGHLVGLGHTADRQQIMRPATPHPAAVWGAGDRTGLLRLGRAMGCRP
jgi:hypothetical protein